MIGSTAPLPLSAQLLRATQRARRQVARTKSDLEHAAFEHMDAEENLAKLEAALAVVKASE